VLTSPLPPIGPPPRNVSLPGGGPSLEAPEPRRRGRRLRDAAGRSFTGVWPPGSTLSWPGCAPAPELVAPPRPEQSRGRSPPPGQVVIGARDL